MMGGAIFPFIVNSYVHGTSKPPCNILERFFLPSHPACNFSSMHDEIFCKAGDVFRKMADCHPIFHDRNAMFVAERSSIGIRLRRQLFANYRVPVDSVDVKASDNTRVY